MRHENLLDCGAVTVRARNLLGELRHYAPEISRVQGKIKSSGFFLELLLLRRRIGIPQTAFWAL
jgi:hypothetical protein